MRRREPPSSKSPEVPPEIAEGPRISRWAHLETLEKFAAIPTGADGRREAMDNVMLSAFRRYLDARAEWERDGGERTFQTRRSLWSRRPYFDPPGTPTPLRLGYASEPGASNRAWLTRASSRREDIS